MIGRATLAKWDKSMVYSILIHIPIVTQPTILILQFTKKNSTKFLLALYMMFGVTSTFPLSFTSFCITSNGMLG